MIEIRVMRRMFLVLAALMLVLVACGADEEPEAGSPGGDTDGSPSGTITLYTSVPQPIADRIQEDFETNFADINLEVFRAGTSDVVARIATENEAGEIQADLVWVAEPSTYEDFKSQDLLLQYTPEAADALAEDMKDPDGYYYAGRVINMVIGYNTSVEPVPTSWADLTSGVYNEGQIGFPTPLRSGAAEGAVRAMTDAFGWEYFETFKANGGVQVQSNSTARDQLATGELQVSAGLDYIFRQAIADGSPVGYSWPEDGAVIIPSPIAIFNDSDNPEAAQAFMDYVLSQEGQQVLVELGSFYPVRDDVDPPEGTPALSEIESLSVDWRAAYEQREELADQWESLFGE